MTFSVLGIDIKTKQRIELPSTSRPQGLYIIGATGTGKSGLIENLCYDDSKQGRGFCVIDPHGQLIERVIARLPPNREKDVILLDINDYHYPFGLNIFTCADLNNPINVQETVDRVCHVFEKLLDVSQDTPLISQYLFHCTYLLIFNPDYTMADIPLLLTDGQCRNKLLANVPYSGTKLFWKQHDLFKPDEQRANILPFLRRVERFLQPASLPIVGQSASTIDLQKIMDAGKILLVKLDVLQLEQVTNLIGSLLLALFLNVVSSRTNKNLFNLYVDEFQRFATEDFATLLTEARKFGIGTTIAHQARYQPGMTDGIRATTLQAANIVVFRVPTDAEELAKQFDTTPVPVETRQEAIRSINLEPLNWFRQGHSHANLAVSALVLKYLRHLFEAERRLKTERSRTSTPSRRYLDNHLLTIDEFFLAAMHGKLIDSDEQNARLLSLVQDIFGGRLLEDDNGFLNIKIREETLFEGTHSVRKWWDSKTGLRPLLKVETEFGLTSVFPTQQDTQTTIEAFVRSYQGKGKFPQATYDALFQERCFYYLKKLFLLALRHPKGFKYSEEWFNTYEPHAIRLFPTLADHLQTAFEFEKQKQFNEDTGDLHSQAVHEWWEAKQKFESDVSYYHYAKRHGYYNVEFPRQYEVEEQTGYYHARQKFGRSLYQESIKDDTDPVIVLRKQKAIQLAQEDIERLSLFLRDWEEVANILKTDPILNETGQFQVVPIFRTHQDMQEEIEKKLVHLPDYIARVKMKIEETIGGVKQNRIVEHTIQTLKPGTGLYGKVLQDRLDRIHQQNITGGYIRPLKDVEAEITKRQTQCSQQPQPQQLLKAAPASRKGKICQYCSTPNRQDATFCDNCGTQF